MRELLIVSLAALALVGCDTDKAQKTQKALKQAASAVSQGLDESKVLAYAQQLVSAVESRDMGSLKRLCADQGDGDFQAIMTCYYSAFAIENDQGVDAARRYLADEATKEGSSPARAKAVAALNEYFTAKGSLRTKEVAALVLIIALETKYPHRGGILGQAIAENLGLMNLPKSATQPASQGSSPSPVGG